MSINTFYKTTICLLGALTFCQLTSCNVFQPDTAVPAYLRVDSTVFTNNFANTKDPDDPSANITDVWAYTNNNPIGVYDVPALFPVLNSGNTLVELSAGVEENGISNTRVIYPFYTYDTLMLNLQTNHTTNFIPRFSYRPATKFSFVYNFEQGTPDFDTAGMGSQTLIQQINTPGIVKYGKYCGLINLTTSDTIFAGALAVPDTFASTSTVYLEMDYMCNIPFNVGVTSVSAGVPTVNYFIQVNTKGYWNKIYINITPYLVPDADDYAIDIEAGLPTGTTSGQVYLDNIKLVHF